MRVLHFQHQRRLRVFRAAVWVAVVGLLMAGGASAYSQNASTHGRYRGQCKRLSKQIRFYEKQMLPLAIESKNLAWEDSIHAQITRISNKRADLCPEWGRERARLLKALDQLRTMQKALARAARIAARAFTAGVGP